MTASDFTPISSKMKAEGLPDLAIETFRYYYQKLAEGQTGMISEAEIEPVTDLPDSSTFPSHLADIGEAALGNTVFLKLNGGLGTSMGLQKAKSLLEVKDGQSFLDIIAQHTEATGLQLLLMNSFATQADSLAALKPYPSLWGELPLDFVQHKIPKIRQDDLTPVAWPANPELEWCPPGHGDIYTALVTSGMLDKLLAAGFQYAFVSNSDNLGAIIDPTILGYFVENKLPFMMEVTRRTPADSKGGHLARRKDGQLILREIAQCPDEDVEQFQNINRHQFFNTNNLWIHLPSLKELLTVKNNILGLPMIRNAKTVDPRDPDSPAVYQIETAMGTAIGVFSGSGAVNVPRTRFAPVKKTNDLLALRSDLFELTDPRQGITPNPARSLPPILIDLDSNYYKHISEMEARFPQGAPSLLECEQLTVVGDFKFGQNITMKGNVTLTNHTDEQKVIGDGVVINEQ